MIAWILNHSVTLITFIPIGVGLLLWLIPARQVKAMRWAALIGTLIPFGLALVAWAHFDNSNTAWQLSEQVPWYLSLNASYHVGVDGISLTMVLLTTFLMPLAILTSFNITEKVRTYMQLFLLLETAMLGVFVALDLLLFFVFWEVGLVPMYFLIAGWGGRNRNYASLKFILFTMGGSLGLLLATQMLGMLTGSFDLLVVAAKWQALDGGSLFGLPLETVRAIAFWAFVIAFAVKVPVWPFHTWLPDAHTEAPTAGSMILAGVLLKLGAYGFIRLVLPLFPAEAKTFAPWLAALAVAAVVMGALGAWGQNDFKRLVAYSSINHMGFVILAVAAAGAAAGTPDAHIALNGAVLQMVAHGLSSAGMFFLVGAIYERTHTRELNELGGLYARIPVYSSILTFTAMASLGLPGLAGFAAEFQIVRGVWPVFMAGTVIALVGLFFTGAYILKALKLTLHGPLDEHWKKLTDLNARELAVVSPLMALSLFIGVWPAGIMTLFNLSVAALF
ncbi:MAG: NADH-quinone oxidoreductase subunit M [Anaerolineaceae bacterium]|nr:NADH-quinone oxidoreductase subunit M [Anaerolineaceae bacterium]